MREKYIIKTFQGLESILEQELHSLGIMETQILTRSVAFEGSFEDMMLANLSVRTGLRIYKPFFEFEFENEDQMYRVLREFEWSRYLSVDKTFSIENVIASKQIKNSHFISLKTKDAIVDYFRDKYNKRPSVDTRWPDVKLQIYISQTNKCVVSIDTTGEPLYKRGYKKRQTEASMNECLASGLILLSQWNGVTNFYDMMCGSGTLTAEAILIASHYPPNLKRKQWSFMNFEGYSRDKLIKIQKELEAKIIEPAGDFYMNDESGQALDVAKMNIYDLPIRVSNLFFSKDNFFEVIPKSQGILILNPPYDERLEISKADLFYKDLGDMIKRHYKGFDVWIISSNKSGLKKIGLKTDQRFQLFNGGLPCEFCEYKIF